jgi:hypothetical protein
VRFWMLWMYYLPISLFFYKDHTIFYKKWKKYMKAQ